MTGQAGLITRKKATFYMTRRPCLWISLQAMKSPKVFFIIVLLAAGQASAQYTWTNLAGDSHHPVEDSGRQNRSRPGFPVCAAAAGHALFGSVQLEQQ
jgi:hypothetical protein